MAERTGWIVKELTSTAGRTVNPLAIIALMLSIRCSLMHVLGAPCATSRVHIRFAKHLEKQRLEHHEKLQVHRKKKDEGCLF